MRRIAASVKRRPVLLASLLTATLLVMCERYHASATIKVVNDAGVTLQNVQLKGPCFVRTGVAMDPGAFKTYWVFPCGEHATLSFQVAHSSHSAVGYLMTLPHGQLVFTVRPGLAVNVSESPQQAH